MKFRDLNLSYEAALHGVQSAIKYDTQNKAWRGWDDESKHLRVGVDSTKAEMAGLASLLIDRGLFTEAEYIERMRLAMNEELVRYEEHCRKTYGNLKLSFR